MVQILKNATVAHGTITGGTLKRDGGEDVPLEQISVTDFTTQFGAIDGIQHSRLTGDDPFRGFEFTPEARAALSELPVNFVAFQGTKFEPQGVGRQFDRHELQQFEAAVRAFRKQDENS